MPLLILDRQENTTFPYYTTEKEPGAATGTRVVSRSKEPRHTGSKDQRSMSRKSMMNLEGGQINSSIIQNY